MNFFALYPVEVSIGCYASGYLCFVWSGCDWTYHCNSRRLSWWPPWVRNYALRRRLLNRPGAMGQFPGRDFDDVDSTRPCLILVREAFYFQKTSQFSFVDDISSVARLTRNKGTSVHSRARNLLAGYKTIIFLVSAIATPKS